MDKTVLCVMCLALYDEYQGRKMFVGTVTVTGHRPEERYDPGLVV